VLNASGTLPSILEQYANDSWVVGTLKLPEPGHYFVNKGFFRNDAQLLENAFRIRYIPGVIVQGRYDVVCPMESAWALHRAWPEAEFLITADSGPAAFDPPNSRALVAATDRFALDSK
jgi:proline iminopeptidase